MNVRMIQLVAPIFAALSIVAAASAGRIALRPAVQIEQVRPLTLADIAQLHGASAEALAEVVIVRDLEAKQAAQRVARIGVNDVRRALDEHGVNWGRLTLNGGQCAVRVVEPAEQAARGRAAASSSSIASESSNRTPAPIEPTFRDRVVDLLTRMFDVAHDDLRASFHESEGEFLDTPLRSLRVEVQPGGKASSSRIPVVVWVYKGANLIESRTIRADVRIRRRALVLAREIQRDQRIKESDLNPQSLWHSPTGSEPVSAIKHAIGAVAKKDLSAGTILRTSHLESPVIIERGEVVTVHCLSGAIVVKGTARAMNDAREGEAVELRLGRDRESFTGRAAAPGRVIVNLDHHNAQSRENESADQEQAS